MYNIIKLKSDFHGMARGYKYAHLSKTSHKRWKGQLYVNFVLSNDIGSSVAGM